MKNQFLLAFNEICKEKNLPPDTVIEALKTALVSAYRRNSTISNSQGVEADVDPRTGEVTVFAEKEVAESVIDDRTEVTLEYALSIDPQAALGDLMMVDSTPKNFGRIAAQTAKQVILQRVREAERDHLYDEFSDREGELVNGTVQSTSGGNLTIGLGRTEALLPRGQQVMSERYRAHDKIRVYILEVRKSNRGPQIFVSRTHRNLLRRLLELEVPEIYNGQVDIKSIAREAGARSKVAVKAMQPGVDPVGACVGMRGVRIQSIVRELNDEKIDVIEWDQDPTAFIAKALSPARVALVFLDDDPINGRTATVIVPDDQLSLAIGREGQNARLAAKLTSWRVDIKSLTEAGRDSLNLLDNPMADPVVVKDFDLHARVLEVIEKKEAGRPITAEDFNYLNRFVSGIEGCIIGSRAEGHDETRRQQFEAHEKVPEAYWTLHLEELNLPMSIHTLLLNNGYETVGQVMFAIEMSKDDLFALDGFTDESLDKVNARLSELELPDPEPSEEVVAAESDTSETAEAPISEEVVPAPAPLTEQELEALQKFDLGAILAVDESKIFDKDAAEEDEIFDHPVDAENRPLSEENKPSITVRRVPGTAARDEQIANNTASKKRRSNKKKRDRDDWNNTPDGGSYS